MGSELADIVGSLPSPALGQGSPIFLPQVTFPSSTTSGVAPSSTLNDTASTPEDRQATVAAEWALIRIVYGRDRLGAQVANVLAYAGNWIIQVVWCRGPIDAIESESLDDKALPDGASVTHYLGTSSQTVNATLVSAFAAIGITYTDALPYVAYSVFVIPDSVLSGFPQFAGVIRGLKVYDSRADSTAGGSGAQRLADPSTWAWSDCPALHTADLVRSPEYGQGKALDWSTVAAVADLNDELDGSGASAEKHRLCGLTLDTEQDVADWLETLRTYAGCAILDDAGTVSLVADAPADSEGTLDWEAGQISRITKLKKRDPSTTPTVLTVVYTDTSVLPWRDGRATAYAPGVLAGTTPFRPSDVRLPGIKRYSQALREATERLNKLTLTDLSCTVGTADEGIAFYKGAVLTINAPTHGLTSKLMRIDNARTVADGWEYDLLEYDPAVFASMVVTQPTSGDTTLPRADQPVPATDLVLTEDRYSDQALGVTVSKVQASWTPPSYPLVLRYRIEIIESGRVVDAGDVQGDSSPAYLSIPLQKGKAYTVNVYTVSTLLFESTPLSGGITVVGKNTPPGDVPRFTQAFEIGGEVFLKWDRPFDTDFLRYELRTGPTSATWETASFYDQFDSQAARIRGLSAGTVRCFVKAIDTSDNYSTNAIYVDVTVTSDESAFLLSSHAFATPTLTNMSRYFLEGDAREYFVTDQADTWDGLFPSTLDSYTNVLATYHGSGTSSLVTESYDFGAVVAGNFTAAIDYSDLSGTAQPYIELSDDNSTWSRTNGLTVKGAGRYVRVGIETLTTGTLLVHGMPSIRVDAQGRKEASGTTVTSASSGPTTINLTNKYTKVLRLVVSPTGTSATSWTVDNIVLSTVSANSFDVYLFDAAGTQVARDFYWEFEGI